MLFSPMSDRKPYQPRIDFLRDILPEGLSEAEIQTEEARLIRYMALIERIALQEMREEKSGEGARKDSTQCD
mgnify:FL=1